MDDCIFCKIIKGDIPCYKIYEDDKYLAFLDIKPLSKGHTLVLPKTHYANIHEIPQNVLCELMGVVKKVSKVIDEKMHPSGIVLNQNNGESAGQTVMHFHMHIKPIYDDTPKYTEAHIRKELSEEEMKRCVELLKVS